MFDLVSVACGVALGVIITALWSRARSASLTHQLSARQEQLLQLDQQLARELERTEGLRHELEEQRILQSQLQTTIEKDREAATENLALLTNAQARLAESFKNLSTDALNQNNQRFLELAQLQFTNFQDTAKSDLEKREAAIKELVVPLKQSMEKFDHKLGELEKERVGAYEGLRVQVRNLLESQNQLRSETGNLVKALRTPNVRGNWGEVTLKNVVEMAGMLSHCDFGTQTTVATEDSWQRPDLTVKLPGGKSIVVDAKAPLDAYLRAIECTDDLERADHMRHHARQIREHLRLLGQKAYWQQFTPSPEFVILFLPRESLFSAALEHDPSLIEHGVNEGVILATPTTLISLLKAVSYGWKQESLADNARRIAQVGKELYDRLLTLGGHFSDLGRKLGGAVESYNRAMGSFESRVLVSARRFGELQDHNEEMPTAELLDKLPRQLQAEELIPAPVTLSVEATPSDA